MKYSILILLLLSACGKSKERIKDEAETALLDRCYPYAQKCFSTYSKQYCMENDKFIKDCIKIFNEIEGW